MRALGVADIIQGMYGNTNNFDTSPLLILLPEEEKAGFFQNFRA